VCKIAFIDFLYLLNVLCLNWLDNIPLFLCRIYAALLGRCSFPILRCSAAAVFFVGGLFQPTLRILSENASGASLGKTGFISERIQLNEARLGC